MLTNISATTALSLSDGTPVELVKITSKNNIQVRLPASHPLAAQDPLRIFRRDGTHYKDQLSLTLVATAPTTAPVTASNDNVSYEVEGTTFDTLADAKLEALDLYDGTYNVQIVAVSRKVVGVVGFTALAA